VSHRHLENDEDEAEVGNSAETTDDSDCTSVGIKLSVLLFLVFVMIGARD
jgi:hypothetical protein